jgi:hypothetical protein
MSHRRILETLSKNLNSYQSTRWLKTENDRLNGSTPAELMMEDQQDKVFKILDEEIKRIKSKKNTKI